jgi:excreted virulence factor EspC (type VII ESX diderm)
VAADNFQVNPQALVTHAASVEQAADGLAAAKAAASTVSMNTAAYGKLMYWLPPLFSDTQRDVLAALGFVEASMREAAVALREGAAIYERGDTDAAQAYRKAVRG